MEVLQKIAEVYHNQLELHHMLRMQGHKQVEIAVADSLEAHTHLPMEHMR